jgi:hypothetical protein
MAIPQALGPPSEWSSRAIAEWFAFATIWLVFLWGVIDRVVRRLRRRAD